MIGLEERRVVVTGAASGIGEAVVRRLVRSSNRVIAVDRDADGLAQLGGEEALAGQVSCVVMDLGDPASIESGLGEIAEVTRGRLSGLVNCAGVNPSGRFEELKVGDWEQAFAVNVVGAYLMMVGCAPLMRANGGGAVVNVSSAAGKVPSPFQASYGASKAALISLTRSAAVALAPQIRVNSVCPGIVDTPLWQRLDARMESLGASLRFATRAAQAPAGRPALADEVAMVIAFLLSNDAVFITGEDVNVSGGLVMY